MTAEFELKGWHVFAIIAGAFAVIIGVNVFMAYQALHTFPGLEARNGYVESQAFDRDRAAQEALGWDVAVDYQDGLMTLAIDSAAGPVKPEITQFIVGRPTMAADDVEPDLRWTGREFEARLDLAHGKWTVHLRAIAPDGTKVRKRFDLWVE